MFVNKTIEYTGHMDISKNKMLTTMALDREDELHQLRNEKKAIERAIHYSRMHKIREYTRLLETLKAYDRALNDIETKIEEIEDKIKKTGGGIR
jgi:predicted  nucleic acid-binding Zn-ribbon protein